MKGIVRKHVLRELLLDSRRRRRIIHRRTHSCSLFHELFKRIPIHLRGVSVADLYFSCHDFQNVVEQ
jgi:hypothetical protein